MVDAGRILIMPKGIWSNLESYEMLDVGTQDGVAYIARKSSVGQSPKLDTAYTYWQPFGTAVTPDGTTIIMDANDDLAVNLDNRTLVYDGTNSYIKVSVDGSTIKYDSTNGYLYVDASSFDISDLNDITITSPSNGQILIYDSTTQKWKNADIDFGTVLSGTLQIGATSLTFTNSAIGNNSLIDIYTDPYGIAPTGATQSGTTVTLTFDPQSEVINVKLVVKN